MTSARMFLWGLRHKRRRQLAIVLVIALTASVVTVFASALNVLVKFAETSHSELIIGLARPRLDAWDVLGQPVLLYPKLQKLDGVHAVSRYLLFGGKHPASGTKFMVAGEDDEGIVLHRSRFWVDDATVEVWKKDPIAAIPSDALARALNLKVGQLTADRQRLQEGRRRAGKVSLESRNAAKPHERPAKAAAVGVGSVVVDDPFKV